MKTLKILFAIAIATSIASCGSNESNDNKGGEEALSGTIKIDGSSTVYPISEAVAEEFRAEAPDVKVTIGSSGSGAGFKKFARGETDISDASRAIKESEVAACKEAGIDFTEITVAYDGLAVFVNKDNDWLSSITVADLKKLWEPEAENVITRWNQLNPEWPDAEIHLFGPSTAHGTYDYFTEEIMGESGSSRSDYTACADYNVMVQGVSTDKYALGYVGLAFVESNADALKIVSVDNGNGPILPSKETVSQGTYTPLGRSLFMYIKNESMKRPEVKAFVNFYLDNAAELAEDVGYIKLPAEMYTQQKEQLNAE